jgi:hypothetical protein
MQLMLTIPASIYLQNKLIIFEEIRYHALTGGCLMKPIANPPLDDILGSSDSIHAHAQARPARRDACP